MATVPGNEQETIITYDRELDEWHYYSDYPKQNRKWDERIKPTRRVVEDSGVISILEGIIDGNVIIQKKVVSKMSDEERKKRGEMLKQARINSKAENNVTD